MSIKLGAVVAGAAKWLIKVDVEAIVTVGRVYASQRIRTPAPAGPRPSGSWPSREPSETTMMVWGGRLRISRLTSFRATSVWAAERELEAP